MIKNKKTHNSCLAPRSGLLHVAMDDMPARALATSAARGDLISVRKLLDDHLMLLSREVLAMAAMCKQLDVRIAWS